MPVITSELRMPRPGKRYGSAMQQRERERSEHQPALALDADDGAMDALLVAHVLAPLRPR